MESIRSIRGNRARVAACLALFMPCASVALAEAQFADAVFYEAGEPEQGFTQSGVAIGDLDGDGHEDIAVVTYDGYLHVFLNNGDGTFQDAVSSGRLWTWHPSALELADMDRDGDNDLVVAIVSPTGSISVLLNEGDGTFAEPVTYDTCISMQALTVDDLNGDLYSDTASASNCFTAWILLNEGDGSLQFKGSYGVGYSPGGIDAADIDGDGDRDIVYTNGVNSITILLNDGTGAFALSGTFAESHDGPQDVKLADLDADGDRDMISSHGFSNDVAVFKNDGTGVFEPAVKWPVGGSAENIAVGDLDLDGDLDLAVAVLGGNFVALLHNPGDGSFPTRSEKPSGVQPEDIKIGDLNGDARPDMVVSHFGTNAIAVYLNTTQNGRDADNDGVVDSLDCAPENGAAWAVAEAVADLAVLSPTKKFLPMQTELLPGCCWMCSRQTP